MRTRIAAAWLLLVLGWPQPAAAGEPAPEGQASAAISSEGVAAEGDGSFIKRHAPRRNSWQLGVAAGVLLPSRGADLRGSGIPFRQFSRAAADLAFRGGYYPLRFLGVELEGTVMPGASTLDGPSVVFWSFRGQAILQLPWWRIVPFASIGGGALGVRSDAAAVGNDVDGMLALGGGLKFHITRMIGLRFDVRTNLTQKVNRNDLADSEEILLGLVVRLGPRRKPEPKDSTPAPDRDDDGIVDADDRCPDVAGVVPDGCPPDTDGDGIDDAHDQCPELPGDPPNGCPPSDKDNDGFLDADDQCPEQAGIAPDGCPVRDRDGDGVLEPADKCPDEPETENGYEDHDGCPDEVPEDLQAFAGVIEGIAFDVDKATIHPDSRPKLREVVQLLEKYPQLRIEVVGHTDSTGPREHNMELSQRRADAVRDDLVKQGIDASRIETRGAGPDEPIDSNASPKGRARNRRIEFRVLD